MTDQIKKTILYLDTEFNGTGGSLISIALYEPHADMSFYEVNQNYQFMTLNPWVNQNVIPLLGKIAISHHQIQLKLADYLNGFQLPVHVYADWPEDILLMNYMLVIPGLNGSAPRKTVGNISFELITTPDIHISKIPHNALEDAKALYLNHKEMQGDRPN